MEYQLGVGSVSVVCCAFRVGPINVLHVELPVLFPIAGPLRKSRTKHILSGEGQDINRQK